MARETLRLNQDFKDRPKQARNVLERMKGAFPLTSKRIGRRYKEEVEAGKVALGQDLRAKAVSEPSEKGLEALSDP